MKLDPRRLVLILALGAIVGASAACAAGASDRATTATPAMPAPRPAAGEPSSVAVGGETFVAVRVLPASTLSAEKLESAGEGTGDDGSRISLARADSPDAAPWELVSPSSDGWRVWRPKAVLDALAMAGPGAQLVDVMAVDWPDACLGVSESGRVCAQVITTGYRIIVDATGGRIEYHSDRTGARIVEVPR